MLHSDTAILRGGRPPPSLLPGVSVPEVEITTY